MSASRAPLKWVAIATLGGLGFVAFLLFVANAQLGSATGGLVAAAAALAFSLATLFRMVQALARPGRTLAPKARELAGSDKAALREEKRRLLRAINELKFDYEMGKLSEADFGDVKQTYELRAVEVMRRLDGDGQLHPEVFALLEDRGLRDIVPNDADPEESDERTSESSSAADLDNAAEGTAAPNTDVVICAACQGENDPDAKFCKHCGKELTK